MKVRVVGLVMLLSMPVSAQESNKTAATQQPPATKLEAFERQSGSVIIRGFATVGSLAGIYGGAVSVESREFLNAASGKREFGIIVETKETSGLQRQSRSFVDYDEIDSLLNGIDYISKVDGSVTKLGNFQADYRTKGDLEVSTFSSGDRVAAAVTSGRIGSVMVIMKLTDLAKFRSFVADAKAKLDSVRAGV